MAQPIAMGAIEGTLETLTIHGGSAFNIYDVITARRIRCVCDRKTLNELTAPDVMGKRVLVDGEIKFNLHGQPVAIKVMQYRLLRDQKDLPQAKDIRGLFSKNKENTMDILIIADNGGGLTLQLKDSDGHRYQHTYDNPQQCAHDIHAAVQDGHFRRWEGNEAEDEEGNDQWLIPTDEQERNGGYRVYTLSDITEIDPERESWRNVSELATAYNALR